ncbi:MAG: HAD-IIB family hydrolase [Syntrophales bacterium]|jgi:mannosyl-3-phosphoglycerate phosphatase|nr:HAD-IIB family hydrolase [Syntrophales bacterium]
MKVIIFTDLDGTLLDHATYSWEAAAPSLARIREEGIPLIFATSKTRLEVERIQAALNVRDPFIVENGGALFFREGCFGADSGGGDPLPPYRSVRMGKTYAEIRAFVADMRSRFSIRGFGDLDTVEIAELTGLPMDQARLARAREFSEPFLISDPAALPGLEMEAARRGLKVTSGGRFHHLIAAEQDKGRAVRKLIDLYARFRGTNPRTVAIGDSRNDLSMLEQADQPVLIPRPDGTREEFDLPNLVIASFPGSLGWNAVVARILSEEDEHRTP